MTKISETFKSVITPQKYKTFYRDTPTNSKQKMRLTKKKIEEIMLSILGEEGVPLIEELSKMENISEFELADKIKYDIKVVRRMLYLLYNQNLVSFTRKKDKIKGWYIYYWTLLPNNIRFSYLKRKKELLDRLTQKLEEEKKELFFVCPGKCVRFNFDQSMDFEFHCPECGELINQDNNKERIEGLKMKISETEEELEEMKKLRKIRRKIVKEHKKERKVKKRSNTRKGVKCSSALIKKKVNESKITVSKKNKSTAKNKVKRKN